MENNLYLTIKLPYGLKCRNRKRLYHSQGLKDLKREELNEEGYSKEIGSGTDETGFGEYDKNKAPWMKNLHQYLSGPDSMNPDMKNMPGNPHSTLPHFGGFFSL